MNTLRSIGDSLALKLAGCTVSFESDDTELMTYARAHLATLVVPDAQATAPTVSASLRWHDGQPPPQRPSTLAGTERIDRDLYTDGQQLWWFRVDDLRDLHLYGSWRDGRLSIQGDFYYRLGGTPLRDRVRRVMSGSRRRTLRSRRFTTLLSYLVYYPCWWWLEQIRGVHPIHAAGVLTDAGVALLGGPSGVGKSSLAVALALRTDSRLLSDSFLLVDGSDVWAVPEPVLLDRWSREWLGTHAEELQRNEHAYCLGRAGYQLPAARLAERGTAAALVLPRRAPEPFVRRISGEQAHHRLSAADLMVNDLRRYWAFAAVFEQLRPAGLVSRREAQLARLTASIPCYEVGLTAAMTSSTAVDTIRRLLPPTQRRVVGARA